MLYDALSTKNVCANVPVDQFTYWPVPVAENHSVPSTSPSLLNSTGDREPGTQYFPNWLLPPVVGDS